MNGGARGAEVAGRDGEGKVECEEPLRAVLSPGTLLFDKSTSSWPSISSMSSFFK